MIADIAGRDRPEQGIDQGMQTDIGVGVTGKPLVVRHRNAAKHHMVAFGREPVHIEAGADAHGFLMAMYPCTRSARSKS